MSLRREIFIFIIPLLIVLSVVDLPAQTSLLNQDLKNINGKKENVSAFCEGKISILSFWATWCVPCKKELPHLNKLYEKYKDKGIVVLAINQDTPRSLSKVKAYIRSKRYTFPVLLDPDKTFYNRFNSTGIPLLLVFDKKGKMVYSHLGYMPGDEKKVEELIISLMEDKKEK